MPETPKQDLIRMVDRARAELRAAPDGRTMTGYAIVFNEPTRIRSWEGDFIERIAPGATKKTIRENPPKILFNHGMDPQIGDKPLGVASVLREDNKGLYVEVPLSDTSYNADLAVLMRDGAIDGMSFRFSVIKETWNQKPGRTKTNPDGIPERTIQEIRMPELGPVTFPAYQATTVGMRTAADLEKFSHLPSDKRAELFRILGIDNDRSTPTVEAGTATSNPGAATASPASEPAVTATPAMTINQRQAALIAHGVPRT